MVTSNPNKADRAILDSMNAMVDATSYDELAERLVRLIAGVFQANLCTIWRPIHQTDTDKLVLRANVGIRLKPGTVPPEYLLDWQASSNYEIDGVTPWIAIRQQICLANSLDDLRDNADKPWFGAHRGRWDTFQFPSEGESFQCLLGLPIVYQDSQSENNELVGVLKIESKRNPAGFQPADQKLAERLVPFLGLALKTMMVRELHEQHRQQVIRSLTTALLQQDPATFYQQVVEQTATLLNADVCSLWLVDSGRKKLKLGANYGVMDKSKIPEYSLNWDAQTDQEIDGLTPWVLIRKRAFWGEKWEDLKANLAWRGRWDDQQWKDKPFGCLYAVPLLDMVNNSFGVLKIENNSQKPKFDPVDRATFDLMADFISLAIELNTRLRSDVVYEFFHLLKQPVSNSVMTFNDLRAELSRPKPRKNRIESRLGMLARNLETVRVWNFNVYGLAATRFDAPGVVPNPVALKELVLDAVDNMQNLFPEEFQCNLNNIVEKEILLTPLQKKKADAILFNILDNSFKYSTEPMDIRVEASTISEGIEMVISDSGRGISPDDLLHVFEPYVSKGVDKWPDSMGLGLSTVERLLGELNWEKRIESELGKGTKFYITIPKEAVV